MRHLPPQLGAIYACAPPEQRIRKLCALAVTTPAEQIDVLLTDLRSAIDEHVSLAREALGVQASNIAMRDSTALESAGEESS